MSVQRRALLIGMIGPAIQAIGLLWELVHLLLHHVHKPMLARHIIFEPAVLLVVAGFALTVICVPVALEVARARPEDVEMPLLGRDSDDDEPFEGVLEGLSR